VTCTGGPLPATPIQVVFRDYGATLTVASAVTGGTSPLVVATDNGHNRGIKIEAPGVKWNPDMAIAGNPDGGVTELPLSGTPRPVAGQPLVRITTRSGDAAAY
jgi:hypothetical protein